MLSPCWTGGAWRLLNWEPVPSSQPLHVSPPQPGAASLGSGPVRSCGVCLAGSGSRHSARPGSSRSSGAAANRGSRACGTSPHGTRASAGCTRGRVRVPALAGGAARNVAVWPREGLSAFDALGRTLGGRGHPRACPKSSEELHGLPEWLHLDVISGEKVPFSVLFLRPARQSSPFDRDVSGWPPRPPPSSSAVCLPSLRSEGAECPSGGTVPPPPAVSAAHGPK